MKYDLCYIGDQGDGTLAPMSVTGRCEGLRARVQALLCTMMTAPHATRLFGGGLAAFVGTVSASGDVLRARAAVALSGALEHLNANGSGDRLEASITDVSAEGDSIRVGMDVAYNGVTASVSAVVGQEEQ